MTTPLYPSFEKRIDDAAIRLLREQVDPWAFFNAGYPVRLTTCDGRKVDLQGGGFEGSPRQVFWSRYIEPCIENLAVQEIREAVAAAHKRGVDARRLLPEVQGLLLSATAKIFQRMAEIDQRLRGKGFPQNVGRRSVEQEVAAVREFIEKHVRAELEMWSLDPGVQPAAKEREQKFGIVCSPRQSSIDFASYSKDASASTSIGVLFLDIDNFKSLNSRFTEVVVDREILVPLQTLLRDACAHRGECYRHGGEEFLLLLPNHTSDEVLAFAERLRIQVAASTYQVGGVPVQVTASVGLSMWPVHGSTLAELIAKANSAEHEAKANGKNRVVLFRQPDA